MTRLLLVTLECWTAALLLLVWAIDRASRQ